MLKLAMGGLMVRACRFGARDADLVGLLLCLAACRRLSLLVGRLVEI